MEKWKTWEKVPTIVTCHMTFQLDTAEAAEATEQPPDDISHAENIFPEDGSIFPSYAAEQRETLLPHFSQLSSDFTHNLNGSFRASIDMSTFSSSFHFVLTPIRTKGHCFSFRDSLDSRRFELVCPHFVSDLCDPGESVSIYWSPSCQCSFWSGT